MRIVTSLLLFLLASTLAVKAQTSENRASSLTANQLAEVIGVHWWIVRLPSDLGLKDKVCVSFVNYDGKEVAEGCGFSSGPGLNKLGPEAKVFCWEDEASHQIRVQMQISGNTGTSPVKDFFDQAAVGGPANGTVLKPDDILIKFDSSKRASMTNGNELLPGQIGMKVVIKRG